MEEKVMLEDLRKEINELKAKVELLEKNEDRTREVVDANVIAINRKMIDRANSNCLFISALCTSVLIVMSAYFLNVTNQIAEYIVCIGFCMISLSITIICMVIMIVLLIGDFKQMIKNRKWRKKNEGKDVE